MKSDTILYSVIRTEHMIHNDFFLRYLEFEPDETPTGLTFSCRSGGIELCAVRYAKAEITARLRHGAEEAARYRASSLKRKLGLSYRPQKAIMHEHFSFFASQPADELAILCQTETGVLERRVPIHPYVSPNRYIFPLSGAVLVTDTYPAINSHRWCRNSEFAFDAGAFDETLSHPIIAGAPVFAACGGTVEEVFDGLPDTTGGTDLEEIETQYGEHARIDGNHVLLRHPGGELSLYAHLQKGSIPVAKGQPISPGQQIGRVGSSGSSYIPHLQFHVMLEGIEGPGVPVVFDGLKTICDEPCLLDDTVNLVRADPLSPQP